MQTPWRRPSPQGRLGRVQMSTQVAAHARVSLDASDEVLAQSYDVALLDLDGVVYVGPAAVPGAADVLARVRELGMRLAFATNNASRTPHTVAAHLHALGIPAAAEEVVTSAQAAARVVAGLVPAGSNVLVVGGDGLVAAVEERGLVPVFSAEDEPAAVVQGYSPDMDWHRLAEGAYALARGIAWVASNTDLTIPTARGIAPGNGTLVNVLRQATGRDPVVAGKPELPMHREAMLRSGAARPLVVGDRLDTDIEAATRAGVPSLLVLTGVTKVLGVLTALPEHRPNFLAYDLAGLLTPHPAVVPEAGGWTCGAWRASVVDGHLDLHGPADEDPRATPDPAEVGARPDPAHHAAADRLDALRAAAAAVWSFPRVPELNAAAAVLRLVTGVED